jgi:uncharacterized membrane protein
MEKNRVKTSIKHRQVSGSVPKKIRSRQRLNRIVRENIQTIIEHREQIERSRSLQERVADGITDFSGNMGFVTLHVIWFAAWLILNTGWFGLRPFDPFPYGLLTMIVSLEAIFLSTFVLISQNRMSKQDEQRAALDLQINLLTEHELTRALKMLDAIQEHLGIKDEGARELAELEKETKPADVLKEIEQEEERKKDAKAQPQENS